MTQVCAQRHELATTGRFVPGSGEKPYKVTAFRPDEFPFCSCRAYIFGRSKEAKRMQAEGIDIHQKDVPGSCKHLDMVLAQTCDWRQERDADYQFSDVCPKCAGPLVEEGATVLPDDDLSAIDDLRALQASLRGEDAPAPLPKPKPFVIEFTEVSRRQIEVVARDADAARAEFEARDSELRLNGSVEIDGGLGEVVSVSEKTDEPAPAKKPARKRTPARQAVGGRKDVSGDVADLVARAN